MAMDSDTDLSFAVTSFYGKNRKRKDKYFELRSTKVLELPVPKVFKPGLFGPSVCWRTFYRQQEAFDFVDEQKGESLAVFAFEDSTKIGGEQNSGQRRYLVSSVKQFWHHYSDLHPHQRHHYEVIREGSRCKLYFDLEFMKEFNPGKDSDTMVDILIKYVCLSLEECFGVHCDRTNVLDLDASTASKYSRHLVFQLRYAVFQNCVVAGYFVRHIMTVLSQYVRLMTRKVSTVSVSPCSKNLSCESSPEAHLSSLRQKSTALSQGETVLSVTLSPRSWLHSESLGRSASAHEFPSKSCNGQRLNTSDLGCEEGDDDLEMIALVEDLERRSRRCDLFGCDKSTGDKVNSSFHDDIEMFDSEDKELVDLVEEIDSQRKHQELSHLGYNSYLENDVFDDDNEFIELVEEIDSQKIDYELSNRDKSLCCDSNSYVEGDTLDNDDDFIELFKELEGQNADINKEGLDRNSQRDMKLTDELSFHDGMDDEVEFISLVEKIDTEHSGKETSGYEVDNEEILKACGRNVDPGLVTKVHETLVFKENASREVDSEVLSLAVGDEIFSGNTGLSDTDQSCSTKYCANDNSDCVLEQRADNSRCLAEQRVGHFSPKFVFEDDTDVDLCKSVEACEKRLYTYPHETEQISSSSTKDAKHVVELETTDHLRGDCDDTTEKECDVGDVMKNVCHKFNLEEFRSLFVMAKDGRETLFCDLGVYTKNRNFRLYLSSKLHKNNPLILAKQNQYRSTKRRIKPVPSTLEEDVFMASLIAVNRCYAEDKLKVLEFGSIHDHPQTNKSVTCQPSHVTASTATCMRGHNVSLYPNIDLFIYSLVSMNGSRGRIREWRHNQDNVITYYITGYRWCHNIGREHRSNNIFYTVNLQDRSFVQGCYDSDCAQIMRKVESLPPSLTCTLLEDGPGG